MKVSVDELYVIVEICDLGMKINNVIVMWIAIEKWWIESDYDELLEIEWFVDNWLNCVDIENVVNCERCWVEKWDVDDERLNWAFEIVDLRIDELRLNWWNLWIWLSWWIMWIACDWW